MTQFEGLYGRKFRSLICWEEIGKRKLIGTAMQQKIEKSCIYSRKNETRTK